MPLLLFPRHSEVSVPAETEGRSSTGRLPVAWPPRRRGEPSHIRVERGVVPPLPAVAFDDAGVVHLEVGGYGGETHSVLFTGEGEVSSSRSASAVESHTAFTTPFGYAASAEDDLLAIACLLTSDASEVPAIFKALIEDGGLE